MKTKMTMKIRSRYSLLLVGFWVLLGCGATLDTQDSEPVVGAPKQSPAAKDELPQLVRSIVLPYLDSTEVQRPEAVVAVVTAEGSRVFGFSADEGDTPDGDTIYQIGSVSKFFTGLALARLVESGELSTTDLAVDHLGELRLPPGVARSLTLSHLVSHYAGFPSLPRNIADRDGDGKRDPTSDPLSPAAGYTSEDLQRYFDSYKPRQAPGTAYKYSNIGIGLLALALQQQAGVETFHDLLQELVTNDLGMKHTWGEVVSIDDSLRDRVAPAYAFDGATPVAGQLAQMGVLAGAGEMTSTGNDLAKLLSALTGQEHTALDGAIERALEPIAPSVKEEQIGFAIEIEQRGDAIVYKKGGNTPSYSAYISFSRAPSVGVAVLFNVGGFGSVRSLAQELMQLLLTD